MTTHNLTAGTQVVQIESGVADGGTAVPIRVDGLDIQNDPPCANYLDPVYKGRPDVQGQLFLLAEIRGLLKKLAEK
jgi:hypothetical protein|tara:strand:+ start:2853 stop:3080 length:228 start_codon:yes stop_codon:yes gene_type:complete